MSSTWVQIATQGGDVIFNTVIANSYSGSVTGSVTGNLDGTASWASSSLVAYEAPYYTTTASFNTFSSSYVIASGSFDGRLNNITTSFVNFSSSYVVDSGSFDSRILSNSSSLYTFSSSYVITSASFDNRINIVSSSLVNVSSSYESFTRTYNTGSFTGSFIGAFTGDGSGIVNISASSVVGLVLSQIASGSITASVSPAYGFTVNASASVSGTFAVSSSTNAASFKGSGSGLFTVDGTSGRLFTIDDTLTGTLLSVQDALSNPILEVNSDGSVIVSGSIDVTQGITGSLQGTSSWAIKALTSSYADNFTVAGTLIAQTLVVQTVSSSVVYSSGSNVFGNSLSNTQQFTGSVSVTGSLSVNGSDVIITNQTSSMSVLSASYARTASEAPRYTTTASFNSFTQSYINDSSSFNTRIINNSSSVWLLSGSYTTTSASFTSFSSSYVVDSASFKAGLTNLIQRTESFATTGSNIFRGDQTITGSIYGLGNNTFIGSSSFYGQTFISGGLIISSSQNQNPATFQIYGDIRQKGGHLYLPVDLTINPAISGSYIFSSGSTNDLYFGQTTSGSFNVTRLRWLEGNLYTGLLHGGLITIVTGSTTFNVSSGSGIIVSMNASIDTDPYPSVKFINWNSFTNHPLTYLTSSIQTFIGIDGNGQITQQTTPFVNGEYESKILLGTVLHQNQATVNSSITYPNVAYGWKQRSYDFIKAFGPLKLSGLSIITSGSLGLTVGSGTAWADGRNYQVNPNNPSYISDPGTNVSKIFRYYQSGSSFVQDTNGGLGYTFIDPLNYNPNGSGSLQPVPGNGANREWSIQRVFWYPNSATKGIVVYYGSKSYPTLVDAVANIPYEPFREVANTQQNAVYLGAIAIRNNGVFTDSTSYSILPGGVFRSIGGSGGGGTAPAARFIDLVDVTVTSPTDHQAVVYDATNLKFINSSFISASISGNADTATSSSYALSASYALNATNTDSASLAFNAISSSYANNATSAVTASYADNLLVKGTITAQTLFVQSITSSVDFVTGSTHFGTIIENTHEFTGSVGISGSLSVNGSPAITSNQTSSMSVLSASYAATASQAPQYTLSSSFNAFTQSYVTDSASFDTRILNNSSSVLLLSSSYIADSASFNTRIFNNSSSLLGLTNVFNAFTSSYNTGSFSGSLNGTASYANNADTASYWSGSIDTASYAINSTSASYALVATSASHADLSDTSSYSLQALSASVAELATSASYALTASYAMNAGGGGISAIYIADEGVLQGTASYFDFTGAGVTATVTNGTASITVTGGGSGTAVQGASVQFTIPTASATWSINHAINSRTPVVEVYDSNYNVVIPTGIYNPGPYQTEIYFDVPQSGYAIISTGGVITVSGSNAILNQTTASSTWSFKHELNNLYPVFTIYDSNNDVIIPQRINVVDTGSAMIYFSTPRTGTAVASIAGNQGFASSSFSASYAASSSYAVTSSHALTASSADNLLVRGNLTAQTLVVQTVTSSIIYSSGSNIFGNSVTNTQEFTGSVSVTGSLTVLGSPVLTSDQTSSMSVLTASYAATSSYSDRLIIGASLSNYGTLLSSSVGSNIVSTQATGSYTAAFFKYTVSSGSNARAGEVFTVWNGSNVEFTDVSTNDIGTTIDVTGSVNISGGDIQFIVQTNSGGWLIKSIATFI